MNNVGMIPKVRTALEALDASKQGMLNGIVAFEIEVRRLEGKYKLSQSDDSVIAGVARAAGLLPFDKLRVGMTYRDARANPH